MNIRTIGRTIASYFHHHHDAPLREVAEAAGTSISSAHRHKHAIAKRNQHPESWMWDTEDGFRWLIILVCAAIYIFGIRGGIGMDTIAEFFRLIRLDRHIGVSPSSLRRLIRQLETLILEYRDPFEQPKDGLAHAIVGADETFFEQVVLVMME